MTSPGYVIKSAVAETIEEAHGRPYADDRPATEEELRASAPKERLTSQGKPIASFSRRVAGSFIDSSINLVAGFGLSLVLYALILPSNYTRDELNAAEVKVRVVLVLALTVYVLIANSYGRTLGKLFVGIRVIHDKSGAAPGLRIGLARYLVSILSSLVFGLGYISAAWNSEGKTWHDRAAGTSVVRVTRQPTRR